MSNPKEDREVPALEFVDELYSPQELQNLTHFFREQGYVVLPDLLKRETVDCFTRQLEAIMFYDGISWRLPDDAPHYVHPANTPRGAQVLPETLSRSVAKPLPALHTTMIILQKGADDSYIPDWHKDREPDGMPPGEYHWPLDVFLGFYLEDMTDDHGPTLVLPGSHRDPSITPWDGKTEPVAIHCRKQDALLLDQRTWHRGTSRKVTGNRYLMIYGYYAMPHFYGSTFKMPRAQRHAWLEAKTMKERVLYGGPFAPPDHNDLEQMIQTSIHKSSTKEHSIIHGVAY